MKADFKPNDAQRRAIEFGLDTPLKVVAGAGTGKTAVLAQRFVRIVEKHRIAPHRILALTFTKKAAAEMKHRISAELLEKELINRSEAPLLLWIGNFHSICLRLLRQSALTAGLDPSFGTIDEAEARLILEEVVYGFLNKTLASAAGSDNFEDLMIERVEDFVQNALRLINRVKAQFVEPENFKEVSRALIEEQYRTIESNLVQTIANETIHGGTRKKAGRLLEALPAARTHEKLLLNALQEICGAYMQRLKRQDLLDFGDLISRACRLAKADPSIKGRFDYILVDEFQDTDGAQYRLLEALSDDFKNVTVVCDKKQSIYEWREARLENIEEFPGETIFLDENYRSYGEILDSANFFIALSMPEEKPLRPALEGGRGRSGQARVKLFRASAYKDEAEYVARETARLVQTREYEPGEIAVLMRSVRASRVFEDAFKSHAIPYATFGGRGFYDLSETKDLLSLLRLIANPFDDLSMVRILQSDMVGLNDATLHALCKPLRGADSGIYEVLRPLQEIRADLRPRTHDRLLALLDAIQELANRRWSLTLGELISEALDRTGYLKYLASIEGPRGTRFSNVSTFYKAATLFEERHPGAGLEEFLTYLETALAGDAGPAPVGVKRDAVQLMTVHQAKGLEFPVVFVVNLRAGAFPLKFRSDGFGYGERFGLFAKNLPAGGEAVRYRGEYGVGIEKNLRERHYFEECRIMYVAMTRAQDILHLTTSSPEDEEDFFRALESFADEDGARCVEVVRSFSIPAGLPEQETAAAQCGSIAEIRLEAAKAVERIARTPSTGPATGEDWSVALSYSSLVLFRQCPMKYALQYVYNLPLSPHEESGDENHSRADAFALGNLLHGVLMQYHRQNRSEAKADAFDIFENLSRGCPPELLSAGREMIGKYLDSPLSQTNTLDEEKEFHWRIECGHHKIMLEGKIDRIHHQGDSLKIVDYKTGSRREESHRLQLGIYRLAIEAVVGKGNILTSDFYLSTGEEVEYRFTAEELNRIRDDIIEDARKIAAMIFEVSGEDRRHSTDCPSCGYAGFCLSRGRDLSGKIEVVLG